MFLKNLNRRKYVFIALIFILPFLLTSCENILPGNAIGDGGLLSGHPCSAPCFWEVYPGLTTKDQAIKILQRYGASNYQQEGNIISYGNSIDFQNDVNGIVDIVAFAPSSTIAVDALIAKYGVPDAVEVIYDVSSTPENNYFDMKLYYDDLYTHVTLERQETWPAYVLSRDTRIAEAIYFSEKSYNAARTASQHLTGWKGYGSYKDPNPYYWP
jgi:hypothetical protein